MKTSLKVRKCSACRDPFMQTRPLQKVCGYVCAEKDAIARRLKQEASQRKAEHRADRAAKEANKPLRVLLAEAQTAFNAVIRFRDRHQPCICCGQPFEPEKLGGSVDAGHFRSRAAAPQLRFNEENVYAQRKNCNRPGGTTYSKFRAGVIARRGEEVVLALEADNSTHKWQKDEVRAIRDHYREKLKKLKKEAA